MIKMILILVITEVIYLFIKPLQDIPQPKSPHKDNNMYNKQC